MAIAFLVMLAGSVGEFYGKKLIRPECFHTGAIPPTDGGSKGDFLRGVGKARSLLNRSLNF
jgi:hypothetical protein